MCRLDKYLCGISDSGFFHNMLVHVFSQTLHIIHMTKSQSMPKIVQSSHLPPFYVFCHSKIPFKCIEDPFTNQIPQSFVPFNISMLVHVFSQTPKIIHMTKSQSMPKIVQSSPPPTPHFMCFCLSKTPFKCIEDPITNQITRQFVLRGL